MIPTIPEVIIPMDIAAVSDEKYRQLLMQQALFIRKHEDTIKKKAKRLYQIVKSDKQPKLNKRCCNYGVYLYNKLVL